jgi:drug/metabolite transporter (DMT)-like permease
MMFESADWVGRLLLIYIGVSGFLLQFLLTEGLQREKAGRATNLIVSSSHDMSGYLSHVLMICQYTQLVFALIIERVVWGTIPPPESFLGGALILAGAIWVSLQKQKPAETAKTNDEETRLLDDEN